MPRRKTTVQQLAVESEMELDELLVTLWDGGIHYVTGAGDRINNGDLKAARRLVGLATRREISSRAYWVKIFGISNPRFDEVLDELALGDQIGRRRMTVKAINRLRAEARMRDLPIVARSDADSSESTQKKYAPFKWREIGRKKDIRFLSPEQITDIHYLLVEDFLGSPDPILPPGVRLGVLLESAADRPQTALGTDAKYPTVEMAAGALMHSLVHNHPFHNGNKRVAIVSTLVFLDENGILLTCDENTIFKMVVLLAQHRLVDGPRDELADREVIALARWFQSCGRLVEVGNRSIPGRRLRRLLQEHGCELTDFGGRNPRLTITREVERYRLWRKNKLITLQSRERWFGDGQDVPRTTIARIRTELELDEKHGFDASAFYDSAPAAADAFISMYRKTLTRLASL